MPLQKRALEEGSSSLVIIFKSERLAIIIRGEIESRSFVENLPPEINFIQISHALLLAVYFSAVRHSFLQLPSALSGTVLYSQLLLYSLYLTTITSVSSTDSSSSHGSLFFFILIFWGWERERRCIPQCSFIFH